MNIPSVDKNNDLYLNFFLYTCLTNLVLLCIRPHDQKYLNTKSNY